ncbi:MAG: VWA domain-containing protein, partial [Acidimicrobiaceae bacterium]|nr:VWA domain-containing protein [Acidimicrobiaceae bacterium]
MAEPEPAEEPMAEEAADYAYEEAEATAAPAEAVAELQASMAAAESAMAEAESAMAEAESAAAATTSGVSREEAAASDRRRCPECQANTFEDYGVNPFVDTYEDNLSTFALDVDTASYVVTRNYLQGDQLPPIGAVRVEEFVNYFDGGYRTLIDEFNITLEAAPS